MMPSDSYYIIIILILIIIIIIIIIINRFVRRAMSDRGKRI